MFNSVINFLKSFFSFKGRIGRLNYTAYILFINIYGMYVTTHNVPNAFHLIFIILFIKNTFLLIQRLHDLNVSGIWFVLYYLFPPLLLTLCFLKGTSGVNKYGKPFLN
jgi:uncharacterized membrane protein YhaH (DUF805 family)